MAFWRKKDAAAEVQGSIPARPAAESTQPAPAPQPSPAQPPAAAASPTPPELSAEAKRKAAETSRAMMTAFGQIVSVLMRAQHYRQLTLAEVEAVVVPALLTGQFSLAEAHSKVNGLTAPVGVLLWATVSTEVEQRLAAAEEVPLRLAPAEWKSGDNIWIIDAVGEPQMVQAMLKRMAETSWHGRPVKMKARDKDGVLKVGVLSAAPAPAKAQPG